MNYLGKSVIVFASEVIWIYFVIAVFASIEWNEAVFVDSTWWMIAGLIGYGINMALASRIHYIILIVGNGLLLTFILIQNWKLVVPTGSWAFGLIISIAVCFVFVRGASFVFKEPTRQHMLRRFEGNIIIYAILASIFTLNQWQNELFHFVFLFAIFMSLIGMILTLQSHVQEEGNQKVDVQTVGKSGWFTAAISLMLAGIALLSVLLFLPSIRHTLHTLGENGLASLKWMTKVIFECLSWLIGLLPVSDVEGTLPEMTAPPPALLEEMPEEMLFTLPYEWIIGTIGVLVVVIVIWVVSRFLKQWKPPKRVKIQRVFILKDSWWIILWNKFNHFLKRLKMKWRAMFPRFYDHPVYWYYYQVQRWGEKNSLRRLKSETSKEYIEKVMNSLAEQDSEVTENGANDQLLSRLRKLNEDYQATYYGHIIEPSVTEYKLLLNQLKGVKLSRKLAGKVFQNIVKRLSFK